MDCERCEATGKVSTFHGEQESWHTCPDCNGTGWVCVEDHATCQHRDKCTVYRGL